MQRSFIRIGKSTFEVRNGGTREVLFENRWIDHKMFVDILMHRSMWDEIMDLVRGAYILQPDEVAKLLQPNAKLRDAAE